MSWVLYCGYIALGILIGLLIASFIPYQKKETTVEEAVALLKNKGYWVTINIKPKKEDE